MLPVEILPVQETIVLRARGSELLILPHHVRKLKGFAKPKDFSQYFRDEALVNRPARKLFEAWLRKDESLWPRLYTTVHKEMDLSAEDTSDAAVDATAAGVEVTPATPADNAKKPAAAKTAASKASAKDDEQDAKPAKAEKAKVAKAKDETAAPAKKAAAKEPKATAEATPAKAAAAAPKKTAAKSEATATKTKAAPKKKA